MPKNQSNIVGLEGELERMLEGSQTPPPLANLLRLLVVTMTQAAEDNVTWLTVGQTPKGGDYQIAYRGRKARYLVGGTLEELLADVDYALSTAVSL